MNIYLACTVRGDRDAIHALRRLADDLEAAGHVVLTRHLLEDEVDVAEAKLSERQVYERDIEWLNAAEVLIADASGSSFGVGFEVGWVLANSGRTSQRVLLLYRADRRDRISRLIVGNAHPNCTVLPYSDATELVKRVRGAIGDGR
ncbi:MAG TPA: nucleoside 2-deoxyribosyltransferase [Vicinamibacterales bacterium]|jgi:nucleoside 2-deoxyribosyltransferase|nr:nucleoside 2-deoxyribosyltransferase [Vicinamibacterales bacterium]